MNIKKQFKEGLITNNPVLVQLIGMCATMAITTTLFNGVGMGLSVLVILTCCNVVVSAIRKIIPGEIRLAIFVVVIAGFVTIVKMIVQAYMPALYETLGVYLDLITVNCIILGRAEMFANRNPVVASALDGIGMGLGFTLALTAMATIREVLGAGSFAGIAIPFMENYKIEFFTKAPGGLLVYGLLIALIYIITKGAAPVKTSFSCEGCPHAATCTIETCQKKGAEN